MERAIVISVLAALAVIGVITLIAIVKVVAIITVISLLGLGLYYFRSRQGDWDRVMYKIRRFLYKHL